MTLDRDAARALFDSAPNAPAGAAPFVTAPPFAPTEPAFDARRPVSTRSGPNWRLIAPVGVAGLCAVAVLVIAQTRDPAEPGRTVASSPMAPLNPPPVLPAPVETAEVAAPPAPTIVDQPVVRSRVRTTPAARPDAPPRAVAAAPSAMDATVDVSTHEPEPYMATPSVVVPAPTPVTPSATPPIVTPEPDPVQPQPDPVTPPQP